MSSLLVYVVHFPLLNLNMNLLVCPDWSQTRTLSFPSQTTLQLNVHQPECSSSITFGLQPRMFSMAIATLLRVNTKLHSPIKRDLFTYNLQHLQQQHAVSSMLSPSLRANTMWTDIHMVERAPPPRCQDLRVADQFSQKT